MAYKTVVYAQQCYTSRSPDTLLRLRLSDSEALSLIREIALKLSHSHMLRQIEIEHVGTFEDWRGEGVPKATDYFKEPDEKLQRIFARLKILLFIPVAREDSTLLTIKMSPEFAIVAIATLADAAYDPKRVEQFIDLVVVGSVGENEESGYKGQLQ